MYVRRLKVNQLRSIEQAEIVLQYPGRPDGATLLPNVSLLLGNNGAGKTTLLRAICLATLSPLIRDSGFRPYRLIRRTAESQAVEAEAWAEVELHAQDLGKERGTPVVDELATRVEQVFEDERVAPGRRARRSGTGSWTDPDMRWAKMFDAGSPAFLVLGYGASRRVELSSRFDASLRSKSRQIRYERVAGLFEDAVTLTPLGAWLPAFRSENPGRFKQVVNLMNALLPDECRFDAETSDGELAFSLRGTLIPFPALSDGYRAYIGWVADLLYHVTMGAPGGAKLVENRGVVLVDEIDLHLHPEWQRSVVPRLSEALPNIQFVITTHSPIVAGTLSSENIYVMEQDERGASTVSQFDESIHGKSADQVLVSPYFNLMTTRSAAMESELAALSKRASSGDPDASLAFMRSLREGLGIKDEADVALAAAATGEPSVSASKGVSKARGRAR